MFRFWVGGRPTLYLCVTRFAECIAGDVNMTVFRLPYSYLFLDIFFKKQSSTTSIDCRLFTKWLLRIIDGTIHEKQGAAELLIIWLYESLTGKTVKQIEGEFSESFSDQRYQIQLPLYARNTASYALKVRYLTTLSYRL